MRPIRSRLHRVGGSVALAIPLVLAQMYEWGPGAIVRAKLVEGGALMEREVRGLYGGRAAGVLVPRDALDAHELDAGDEIAVPYYEWATVKRAPFEREPQTAKRPRVSARASARVSVR